jgi:hypothetical protein
MYHQQYGRLALVAGAKSQASSRPTLLPPYIAIWRLRRCGDPEPQSAAGWHVMPTGMVCCHYPQRVADAFVCATRTWRCLITPRCSQGRQSANHSLPPGTELRLLRDCCCPPWDIRDRDVGPARATCPLCTWQKSGLCQAHDDDRNKQFDRRTMALQQS